MWRGWTWLTFPNDRLTHVFDDPCWHLHPTANAPTAWQDTSMGSCRMKMKRVWKNAKPCPPSFVWKWHSIHALFIWQTCNPWLQDWFWQGPSCVEEMSAGASFNAAPTSAHRALQQFACFRKLTMNPDTKPQLKDAMHLLVALTLAVHSHATCGVCFQFLSHCMCLKVLKAPFQKSNFHEPIPAWAAWETHECIVWNWTSWGGEDDCVLQLVWQSFAEMTLRWFEFSSIMHGCMFRCKSLKCRWFHCWNIVLSQWNVQTSLEWRKCSLPAKNHLWCSKLLNVVLCGAHMRPGTHCRNVAHVRVSSA